MKKYAVSLDERQVTRMRDEARRVAVKEGRDVTWVSLLRALMEKFVAEAGTNNVEPAQSGGAR